MIEEKIFQNTPEQTIMRGRREERGREGRGGEECCVYLPLPRVPRRCRAAGNIYNQS
jgi:hypothetical protein